MEEQVRHEVALFRYKLISPVLAEPARQQNDYFRTLAEKHYLVPHFGEQQYAVSTYKSWLRAFKDFGFDALKPKPRVDLGRPRKLSDEQIQLIRAQCELTPHWRTSVLYQELLAQKLLGDPPVCYNTLVRLVNKENLLPEAGGRSDVRKRFETDEVNELWICDFLHGPLVLVEKRRVKAILCAIIDDHTRMIVGHAFAPHETASSLTLVLKDAFLAFGIPKRFYVDNGPSFSSDLLASACARAGISLIHSKPYDAPSRGKIERFFRTTRDRFLAKVPAEMTLDQINASFSVWLQEDYHHKPHSGIDARPIDRYHLSASRASIRRLSKDELDEIFLATHHRNVNNDSTISFQGKIYEVPTAYIRQRIEVRHPIDDPDDLWLYEKGARCGKLKLVDVHENARTFKPTPDNAALSFSKETVKP